MSETDHGEEERVRSVSRTGWLPRCGRSGGNAPSGYGTDEQEMRFRAAQFIALDDFLLADPLQLHSALCPQWSSEAANKNRRMAREQYNPNTASIFRLDGSIVLLVCVQSWALAGQ